MSCSDIDVVEEEKVGEFLGQNAVRELKEELEFYPIAKCILLNKISLPISDEDVFPLNIVKML